MKRLGKPFVILLNSVKPYSDETEKLAEILVQKYGVSVLPVNCEQLKREDVIRVLNQVLKEFPVTQVRFSIPGWLEVLSSDHWLKAKVIRLARQILEKITQMKDVAAAIPEEKEEGIPGDPSWKNEHVRRHRGYGYPDG